MSNIAFLPAFKLLPYESAQTASHNVLTVQRTSSWMYCGPLLSLSCAHLPPAYHEWHRATVKGSLTDALLSFLSYANRFLSEAGIHHYWVTIRATKPTSDYDKPRWHTDDDFFQGVKLIRTQWKLVTTLLGPGTLFIQNGHSARAIQKKVKHHVHKERKEHICTPFNCLGCATASAEVRQRLVDNLERHKVVQAATGDCCFFRIGEEQGAVHSEPPQGCDRIFVNIVPGTEVELRDLMSKWGMTTFPRSWSIGMPMRLH
jgi:hypothetical protein